VDHVRVTVEHRGVARLVLDRPERHNALTAPMMDALTRAAVTLGADPAVRVVVLSAEGATFCAGADLGWMRDQAAAGPAQRGTEARRLAGMLAALDALPKPLIARVQGNAFGGGVGLIAVCDIVIGTDAATFGLTETRLGLIPATIGPYVLARIGAGHARRIMLTAKGFDAQQAMAMGLLSQVVARGDLAMAVEAEVAAALACAPGAVAEAKALIGALSRPVTAAMIDTSIGALTTRWDHPEAAEGIAAFLARRKPGWAP
jgi:methylglutaconyl-CoA hydratase